MAQQFFSLLFRENKLRVVRRMRDRGRKVVVELNVRPATARGERLVAGDGQQPSRNRGASLEQASLAPHVEENVAQEVVGEGFVVHQPPQPAVNRQTMPPKEASHGKLTAVGDPQD